MSSRPFVHLHCHSHYSLLDGASKLPALVKRAKALGMPAIAVTDHGNLHGAVEFLREAKAVDLKPIIGMEAYVAPGRRTEKAGGGHSGNEHNFHLTLLARNGEGVRNLMRLSSMAFLEGFYYKPRIDKEILERHSEGLICLSGCVSSEFSDHVLHDKRPRPRSSAPGIRRSSAKRTSTSRSSATASRSRRTTSKAPPTSPGGWACPWSPPATRITCLQEDAEVHDILLCINTGRTFDDPNRMRFENNQFHVRSPEEMYAALPGHEEALATSVRIAEMVEENYKSLNLGKRQFPSFKPPGEKTPEDYLRELCEAGMKDRFGDNPLAGRRRPDGPRAGHHQPDGVRLLLPDRLGLRPLRPRAGHPQLGQGLGLRRLGQLPALSQPRRPVDV